MYHLFNQKSKQSVIAKALDYLKNCPRTAAAILKIDSQIVNDEKRIWNKSTSNTFHPKPFKSFTVFDKSEATTKTRRWQNNYSDDASTTRSSTLSLHIAAYENYIESGDTVIFDKNESLTKKLIKGQKQSLINSSLNPFEFPRQHRDDKIEPAVMQFKTSQQLLNPNQLDSSNDYYQQGTQNVAVGVSPALAHVNQRPPPPSTKIFGGTDLRIMPECFVTLGTTQFDDLVATVLSLEVKKALKKVGIDKVVLQCGAGNAICSLVPEGLKDQDKGCFVEDECGLKIEYFRYKPSIHDDMKSATLIIGHAGAGTCLEALKLHKPIIAVINDKLMNNHQTELADRLAELGHLICTTPSQLHKALTKENLLSPKPFQPSKPNLFSNFLYSKLGYVVTD